MLKTCQASLHRFARQTRHPGTSLSSNLAITDMNSAKVLAKLENDTAQSSIIKEQVGALANHQQRNFMATGKADHCRDLIDGFWLNQQVSRTTDLPTGVLGKRRIKQTATDVNFCKLFKLP
jgi:hypothetical protein